MFRVLVVYFKSMPPQDDDIFVPYYHKDYGPPDGLMDTATQKRREAFWKILPLTKDNLNKTIKITEQFKRTVLESQRMTKRYEAITIRFNRDDEV